MWHNDYQWCVDKIYYVACNLPSFVILMGLFKFNVMIAYSIKMTKTFLDC